MPPKTDATGAAASCPSSSLLDPIRDELSCVLVEPGAVPAEDDPPDADRGDPEHVGGDYPELIECVARLVRAGFRPRAPELAPGVMTKRSAKIEMPESSAIVRVWRLLAVLMPRAVAIAAPPTIMNTPRMWRASNVLHT